MTRVAISWAIASTVLSVAAAGAAEGLPRSPPSRTAWYRESVVNVHFDNHSTLLGKGVPAADLAAMLAGVPATMLQVSAQSNGCATYPTQVGRNDPAAQGYDTLATFREITRRQGKRLCIYMSVDRRPLDLKQHPQWGAVNATGQPEVAGEPIVCQRPHRDRTGYLYERFLPQIREIIRRYDPDGFWFDGDYVLTRPCWCAGCIGPTSARWPTPFTRPARRPSTPATGRGPGLPSRSPNSPTRSAATRGTSARCIAWSNAGARRRRPST